MGAPEVAHCLVSDRQDGHGCGRSVVLEVLEAYSKYLMLIPPTCSDGNRGILAGLTAQTNADWMTCVPPHLVSIQSRSHQRYRPSSPHHHYPTPRLATYHESSQPRRNRFIALR